MSASFGASPMTPKCGAHGNAYALQHAMVLDNGRMIHRDAWVVDLGMNDSERIGLRSPAEIVNRMRKVLAVETVHLVDGDDLPLFRFGNQLVVVEAPPCSSIACRNARPFVLRIGARARSHIEYPQLDHVAWLGTLDGDRSCADMYPENPLRRLAHIPRRRRAPAPRRSTLFAVPGSSGTPTQHPSHP